MYKPRLFHNGFRFLSVLQYRVNLFPVHLLLMEKHANAIIPKVVLVTHVVSLCKAN